MKVKELTVTAVIPTGQYANLQPSITIEVNDDYDAARQEAMKRIAAFSQEYAEGDKQLSSGTTTKKLKKMIPDIGKGEVYFDKDAHTYCDAEGNVFNSGSQFAKQFEWPFNAKAIIPVYAKKFDVSEKEIKDFWKAKADSSTTFGTALHQALETSGKFEELCKVLTTDKKEVTTGIHPTLQPIIDAFFKDREKEEAWYEPFVVDFGGKRCGQIDRLLIVDKAKKVCDIEDYKTNADLYKQNSPKFLKEPYADLPNQPVSMYTLQLNFYREIMEKNGWTVRNLKLHHWTGKEWLAILLDKVPIEEK